MDVQKQSSVGWLLLAFTLPTKRASQRVEVWRKLQHYGTVPLGNSGYLLPSNPVNEERFQWLATAIRKYGGGAPLGHLPGSGNISTPQLIRRLCQGPGAGVHERSAHLQRCFARAPANTTR